MTVTSLPLRQAVEAIAGGRDVAFTGHIDDLQLYKGEPVTLLEAVARIASAWDVHVRMDAADDLTVVHGADRWQPDGDRRVDPVTSLRGLLTHPELTTLVVVDQADIVFQAPADHDIPDRTRVATLQLGLRNATVHGDVRNTCILISSSAVGVPEELLSALERVKVVHIGLPTEKERRHFLTMQAPNLHGVDVRNRAEVDRLVSAFTRLTADETLRGIQSMTTCSRALGLDGTNPRGLLHRWRYGELPDHWAPVRVELARIDAELRKRVCGQDEAIDAVVAGLAGAALGLNMTGNPYGLENQPRLVLMLMGSSGVGKTQLAKAVAEVVMGDPAAYVRFDMSTMGSEAAATRFVGAPPSYVGYEDGGELTEAVRRRPCLVILFDEIEKAHPRIFDPLMSVIDDGRITDAHGQPAYFGEAILIFTTNLGSSLLAERAANTTPEPATAIADLSALGADKVSATLRHAARQYFTDIGRIELWGRLEQGTVAFQPVRAEIIEPITAAIIANSSFAHGPALDIDVHSAAKYMDNVMSDPATRSLGYRQIRNTLRASLQRLATWTVLSGNADVKTLKVRFDIDGAMNVSIGDGPEQRIEPSQTTR